MRDEDWVDLLREAHREPIDPAHYAAVRARVLSELGRQRRPFWRQAWAWALAAAAVAVMMMVFPRPVGRTGVPTAFVGPSAFLPGTIYGPAAPPPRVAVNKPAPVHRRRQTLARVKQEGRPGGPPHLEPVTIKLLTDDPNVIIYWIADAKGE
jgi:hypothetical protein